MTWVVRLLKIGALAAALLWAFGWLAAVVVTAILLVMAILLLWVLLEGESVFWGGVLD